METCRIKRGTVLPLIIYIPILCTARLIWLQSNSTGHTLNPASRAAAALKLFCHCALCHHESVLKSSRLQRALIGTRQSLGIPTAGFVDSGFSSADIFGAQGEEWAGFSFYVETADQLLQRNTKESSEFLTYSETSILAEKRTSTAVSLASPALLVSIANIKM